MKEPSSQANFTAHTKGPSDWATSLGQFLGAQGASAQAWNRTPGKEGATVNGLEGITKVQRQAIVCGDQNAADGAHAMGASDGVGEPQHAGLVPAVESHQKLPEEQTVRSSRPAERTQFQEKVSTGQPSQPESSPVTGPLMLPRSGPQLSAEGSLVSTPKEPGSGRSQQPSPSKVPQPSVPPDVAQDAAPVGVPRRAAMPGVSEPLGESELVPKRSFSGIPEIKRSTFVEQHEDVEARLALLYERVGCQETGANSGGVDGDGGQDEGVRTLVEPLDVADLVELETSNPNRKGPGASRQEREEGIPGSLPGLAKPSQAAVDEKRGDAEPEGERGPFSEEGQRQGASSLGRGGVSQAAGEGARVENRKGGAGNAAVLGGASLVEGARQPGGGGHSEHEAGGPSASVGPGGAVAKPQERGTKYGGILGGIVQHGSAPKVASATPEGKGRVERAEPESPEAESPDAGKENRGVGDAPYLGKGDGSKVGSKSQPSLKAGRAAKGGKEIVQCDECGKLRALGREGYEKWKELNGRDWWACEMAGGGANCDDAEEAEVDTFNVLKPREERVLTDRNMKPLAGTKGLKVSASPAKKSNLASSPHKKIKLGSGKVGTGSAARAGQNGKTKGKKRAEEPRQGSLTAGASMQANRREGRPLEVPDGFTLVCTPRLTEKSMAANAPVDLRYNMPQGCTKPLDGKGKPLTYIQSLVKLKEFLLANQEHPLVRDLTESDFIFAGRKFEKMLIEAYGEGANRVKWEFKPKDGTLTAERAGEPVVYKPLFVPPDTPNRANKGLITKRKRPSTGSETVSKKSKLGEHVSSPHFSLNALAIPRKTELSSKGGTTLKKGGQDVPRTKMVSGKSSALPQSKQGHKEKAGLSKAAVDENDSASYPKKFFDYRLEDADGDMRSVDDLWMVDEKREGTARPLYLVGKTSDGDEEELTVFRWKIVANPLTLAVKLKKPYQWILLDVAEANRSYVRTLQPLGQRLSMLRPLLATEGLTGTDIKRAMQRSCNAEVDLQFLKTWLPRLRSNEDEVSLAMDDYSRLLEIDKQITTDHESFLTTSFGPSVEDDLVIENEVTAEDEEIARTFLENKDTEQTTLGDYVCAICDDGGGDILLVCDGVCMRSFHPRPKDGEESFCEGLKMSDEEVEEYDGKEKPFYCPNCTASQHQCYVCGKLGDSHTDSPSREVYMCDVPGCGHFYHPMCVARFELPFAASEQETRAAVIQDNKNFFSCPLHTCEVCKEPEDDPEQTKGALVKCRRCPIAYHVKCLPSDLPKTADTGEPQRAWGPGVEAENPIDQRLCYCRKHQIDKKLGTPKRSHLKLKPRALAINIPKRASVAGESSSPSPSASNSTPNLAATPAKAGTPLKFQTPAKTVTPARAATPAKASSSGLDAETALDRLLKTPLAKIPEGAVPASPVFTTLKSPTGLKPSDPLAEAADEQQPESDELEVGAQAELARSGADGLIPLEDEPLEPAEGLQVVAAVEADGEAQDELAAADDEDREILWEGLPGVEAEDEAVQAAVNALLAKTEQDVTLSQVRNVLVTPSTYSASGDTRSRIMPKSRLEPICNAIEKAKAAVAGGDPETARRICRQGIAGGERQIDEIRRLESVMRVYLAPFLHGSRYTSFGRHFTHPDKLQQVVERMLPYVEDGDVIVDFCCGANDFSVIMAQRLNETGKTNCQYVNFDLITARNDFHFTKKDWFHVTRADLDFEGRRLIMGLNPPFGVNAALANKFIEHALTWEPKLLVLIVPPVTRRWEDRGYSLCWEDHQIVAGRSFYLPGSVDKATQANLDQWNKVTPPLYLWSHNAYYDAHMQIAHAHGHHSVFEGEQPPPPGSNAAWEQQQAFHFHQQQQALQPQWGPLPGVLQLPQFQSGGPFPPAPGAPQPLGFQPLPFGGAQFPPPASQFEAPPHVLPGGPQFNQGVLGAQQFDNPPQFEPPPVGGGQFDLPPPPPIPPGATPIELRMAADQARSAAHAESEARMAEVRRKMSDVKADLQQCSTERHAWLSKFTDLKAENEQMRATQSSYCVHILDRQERIHIFQAAGDIPAKIQCEADLYGLQNRLREVEQQIAESEAQGQPVYEKLKECDVRWLELGTRVGELEQEMKDVSARYEEQLAALQQAHEEQQRSHMEHRFGGSEYPQERRGGMPDCKYNPGRADGFGADRPHRDEHRRERREMGAPYRHNGGVRDKGQRPSSRSDGHARHVPRPPNGGMGRNREPPSWQDGVPDSIGPIERGEPVMPRDGQWRDNESMLGFSRQGLPPPPPFVPPNAEFQGFPNGQYERPPTYF